MPIKRPSRRPRVFLLLASLFMMPATPVFGEILSLNCPDPILLDRGDMLCDRSPLMNWLGSFNADTDCSGEPILTNDAPCGFPYDSTTVVTFTAVDSCGALQTCQSSVSIKPARRVDVSKKGSLLVFPNIEVKWSPAGIVTQDTFLTVANDYNQDVLVHFLFVNGDDDLREVTCCGPDVERAHYGWTKQNWTTTLTHDQSLYFSVLTGRPSGAPPFTNLDDGPEGPGRPDLERNDGSRVLRGYVLAWAVDTLQHEINWNHLSGSGTVINYRNQTATEYRAFAYGAYCGRLGQNPPDCTRFDDNGACCEAEVIHNKLDLDGFQYDISFDTLIMSFFASGSQPFSVSGTHAMTSADITLLPMLQDLRQENNGAVATHVNFDIWNMNEDYFSGLSRCIWCWDQARFSDFDAPNHFMRAALQTDKGKARIDGRESTAHCGNSISAPLLGSLTTEFAFTGLPQRATSDFDGDLFVDLSDYREMMYCLERSGPESVAASLPCRNLFDFDVDQDVDLSDVREFQNLFQQVAFDRKYHAAGSGALIGAGEESGWILVDELKPPQTLSGGDR